MGNQILEEMLKSIPEEKLYALFGEVFLLHSDVKNDVFESGKPFEKLEAIAERTHIYINKSDDGLLISSLIKNFNKRLGRKGPSRKTRLNDETFIIDASKTKAENIGEAFIDHWGYLYRPAQVKDIIAVLNGADSQIMKNRKPHRKKMHYYFLM